MLRKVLAGRKQRLLLRTQLRPNPGPCFPHIYHSPYLLALIRSETEAVWWWKDSIKLQNFLLLVFSPAPSPLCSFSSVSSCFPSCVSRYNDFQSDLPSHSNTRTCSVRNLCLAKLPFQSPDSDVQRIRERFPRIQTLQNREFSLWRDRWLHNSKTIWLSQIPFVKEN